MRLSLLALLAAFVAVAPAAQTQLTTPRVSPYAEAHQTVGLTELAVTYHRPAVNGRRIFGGLEPYGEVWRAGANENTVFETSTDIQVEGQTLPAGRYGFHTIPGEDEWTIIFSTMADAWGSYSYDPAEDALRVTVTPAEAPLTERLEFAFEDPSTDATTLVLSWAELAVPIAITVDTPAVVLDAMEVELRSIPGFYPDGWNQIARYAVDNGRRLEEALAWAERSRGIQATFANTMTTAAILDALGRADDAREMEAAAFDMANEDEVRAYARERRRAGRSDQAEAALERFGGMP